MKISELNLSVNRIKSIHKRSQLMYPIACCVALLCPPLVVLFVPKPSLMMFLILCFATCWGWIPGVILAVLIVSTYKDSME